MIDQADKHGKHRKVDQLRRILVLTCIMVALPILSDDSFIDLLQGKELPSPPQSTFDKFLPLAETGEPEAQNLIGFMQFHGEGTARNFEAAHQWFHRSAEQNNRQAQYNLALFHSGVDPRVPAKYLDGREANRWFTRYAGKDPDASALKSVAMLKKSGNGMAKGEVELGRRIFTTFCAGCHGFNGIAAYRGAPSFALGERMEKADDQLLQSIQNGLGAMPSWKATLNPQLRKFALAYVRTLKSRHDQGIVDTVKPPEPASTPAHLKLNERGEYLFSTFCGGCHGFNGIAYFVLAPSFALGERMEKSDQELLNSIARGKGQMPSWEDKLSAQDLRDVLAAIRTLQVKYRDGIQGELREYPKMHFVFRPMGDNLIP